MVIPKVLITAGAKCGKILASKGGKIVVESLCSAVVVGVIAPVLEEHITPRINKLLKVDNAERAEKKKEKTVKTKVIRKDIEEYELMDDEVLY